MNTNSERRKKITEQVRITQVHLNFLCLDKKDDCHVGTIMMYEPVLGDERNEFAMYLHIQ